MTLIYNIYFLQNTLNCLQNDFNPMQGLNFKCYCSLEMIIDPIHLASALQDIVVIKNNNLPMLHQHGIIPLVAAFLNYISKKMNIPAFCQQFSKVT